MALIVNYCDNFFNHNANWASKGHSKPDISKPLKCNGYGRKLKVFLNIYLEVCRIWKKP